MKKKPLRYHDFTHFIIILHHFKISDMVSEIWCVTETDGQTDGQTDRFFKDA